MKIKRILTGLVAVALSASMLTGCGGGKGGTGSYAENGADPAFLETVEMGMEAGEDGKITKEVFEPTLLLGTYDFDSMHVFQEAFKYTNVKPKAFIAATSNASQQLDLMLADGSDMADVVVSTITKINDAALEGAFVPLDTLIERFAPNIKAYFEQFPSHKAQSLAGDGNLYVIPTTYDTIASEGFFIRTDWLDKLGLEVPKTVDEYHQALLAFKNQDPNGNGKADEIPFFQRSKTYVSLAQLWGAYPKNYVDENGKVHIGKVSPAWKVAMQNLIQWNKEGLIDPEITTRQSAREELLGNNIGGSTHDWFSSTGSFTKTVKDSHPGEAWAEDFNFAPIAPPADINGEVKEIYSRPLLRGSGWAISATNKNIVETIKYMDWWFTEQGKLTYWYGMEGTDYTKDENGKVTFTSLVLDSKNGVPMYMRENGQLEQGAPMSMEAEMAGMTEGAKEGFAMYESEIKIIPQFPTLAYTPDERAEIDKITVELNTFIDETNAKWYAGSVVLDDAAWDAYIAKCKELGSDKLIEIYQTAYDRLVANGGGVDDVKKNYTSNNN